MNINIDMRVALGYVKLFIAFFMTVGLVLGIVITLTTDYEGDVIEILIGVLTILILSFFLIFYLCKTGIWDIKQKKYKRLVSVFIGLALFIVYIVYAVVFTAIESTGNEWLGTGIIMGSIGLAIGIRDLIKLIRSNKKIESV